MTVTAAAAAGVFLAAAESVVAALNFNANAANQSLGDFAACSIINLLHGGACHLHVACALLLRKSFPVYQADGFVFIHCQNDPFAKATCGIELAHFGKPADFSAFSGSRHIIFLSKLLTYDINCIIL